MFILWKTAEKLNWRTSNLKRNGIKYLQFTFYKPGCLWLQWSAPGYLPSGVFLEGPGSTGVPIPRPAAAGARLVCPVVWLCLQWGTAELPHTGHYVPKKLQLSWASHEAELTQITGFSTVVQLLIRNGKENQLCYHSCLCRGKGGFYDVVTSILLPYSNS